MLTIFRRVRTKSASSSSSGSGLTSVTYASTCPTSGSTCQTSGVTCLSQESTVAAERLADYRSVWTLRLYAVITNNSRKSSSNCMKKCDHKNLIISCSLKAIPQGLSYFLENTLPLIFHYGFFIHKPFK